MKKRGFGDLELAILHILKNGKRMTVKEVLLHLGDENKYTTVMTVMNRLFAKKKLAREKKGLQYEYWMIEEKLNTLAEQIKKKIFGIKPAEMISYLIESGEDLSTHELGEIEKLISAAKEKKK